MWTFSTFCDIFIWDSPLIILFQAYIEDAANRPNITSHILFNKTVISCEWKEKDGKWKIDTYEGESFHANIIFNACGILLREVKRPHPFVKWMKSWSAAKLPDLLPKMSSFLRKMLYDYLPTRKRMHRMNLPGVPSAVCTLCEKMKKTILSTHFWLAPISGSEQKTFC